MDKPNQLQTDKVQFAIESADQFQLLQSRFLFLIWCQSHWMAGNTQHLHFATHTQFEQREWATTERVSERTNLRKEMENRLNDQR